MIANPIRPLRAYRLGWLLLISSTPLVFSFAPDLQRPALSLSRVCHGPRRHLAFVNQRCEATNPLPPFPFTRILSAAQDGDVGPSEALETPLQALFNKYCDSDGLMNKAAVMSVPSIAELLAEDVEPEEFSAIWNRAPKFPDDGTSEERVDVDSFVQIYRDIDDLFEEESESSASDVVAEEDEDNEDDDEDDEAMEAELEGIFGTICDKDNLLSLESIKEWDEVQKLLEEGLLGEDELDELWARTKKAPGSTDRLDVDGFLSFNIELDGLFEFDDDEFDEEELNEDAEAAEEAKPRSMVEGDDLPVAVLFSALMGQDRKVGKEDLFYWSELKEMIRAGDLLESELDSMFVEVGQGSPRLDESQFAALVQAIDDLFEDDAESDMDQPNGSVRSDAALLKSELLDTLRRFEDPDLLPCGLDLDEREQKEIMSIVSDLESQPTNIVRQQASNIQIGDLAGTWDLIYTSSSAMRFNKGLSGIGGSFPNGRFAGVKQELKASKYMTDVEYTERIEVNPSSASFDVKVTGSWDIQTSVSLFTGEPSVILTIVPDMVTYGPTSTRADHWKSLGPTNMLDISYLDDDLRIMRGNTAVDNIFIYRRSSP